MNIKKFKEALNSKDGICKIVPANNEEILLFEKSNNVLLPQDLIMYFKNINGTNEEYDNRFFQFYSLQKFKSINEELKYWTGLPDYSGIVHSLKDYSKYFVFADYSFHMFSYAIYLHDIIDNNKNEVLIICGNEYKKIANSFSEFVELYLKDSGELSL